MKKYESPKAEVICVKIQEDILGAADFGSAGTKPNPFKNKMFGE